MAYNLVIPTTIKLDIFQRGILVPRHILGLTRDEDTRKVLRNHINSWLSSQPQISYYVLGSVSNPFNLQPWIDKYSEQPTNDAFRDMAKSFLAAQNFGVTIGGAPTSIPVLDYFPKKIPINTSSLGAIGEGLAGIYLTNIEHQTASALHRNIRVCPDFVLKDANSGGWILAEVKTTSSGTVVTPMKSAVFDVLDVLAKTKLIRKGAYLAYVIGVVIKAMDHFEIHRLRIEEK